MRALAVLLLLIGLACGARAQEYPNWYEVRAGKWAVPEALIGDIYPLLEAAARRAPPVHALRPLSDFTVQYQGVVADNDARLVRLGGACSASGSSPEALRSGWLTVLDGGTCYFDATYDPLMKRIVSFHFHGFA